MFERKKYKSFAKKQLAGRWSIPVFITVIVSIVSLIFSRIQSVQIKNSGYMDAALSGDIDSIMLSWQTMAFPMFSSSFIEMIVMSVFSIATIGVYLGPCNSRNSLAGIMGISLVSSSLYSWNH